MKDLLKHQRLTVASSILGPQRLLIELAHGTIPVQMTPSFAGPGKALFAFEIDGNHVLGLIDPPVGILHRNDKQFATIQPNHIPTRKRLAFRTNSLIVGHLNYGSQQLPLSCTLWMGLVGTDFLLRDTNGRHLAFWKRWNTRTRVLISSNLSREFCDAILGMVLYLEVDKDISC